MRPPDMVGVGTYFVVGRDTGGGRRWYRLIGPLPEAELPSRVLDRSYDTSYIGLGRGSFNSLRRVLRFPRCLLSGWSVSVSLSVVFLVGSSLVVSRGLCLSLSISLRSTVTGHGQRVLRTDGTSWTGPRGNSRTLVMLVEVQTDSLEVTRRKELRFSRVFPWKSSDLKMTTDCALGPGNVYFMYKGPYESEEKGYTIDGWIGNPFVYRKILGGRGVRSRRRRTEVVKRVGTNSILERVTKH